MADSACKNEYEHITMNIQPDHIYNIDCLEGMKHIPDASIDCIICDLPYQVLHKNNQNVQWDRMIPLDPLWAQYIRITKKTSPIILFCQGMFTAKLMMSQPKLWRYNLIWEKGRSTGFLNANRMPLRSHEDIAVFYRSLPTYNPQFRDGDSHPQGNGPHKHTNQCYGSHNFQANAIPNGEPAYKVGKTYDYDKGSIKRVPPTGKCFPNSVLHFPKDHNADTWHPTQKPVDLVRYLIRTYTNENDIVLDNAMGSATTAIAALRERRHFLGFELSSDYYQRSLLRLQHETNQLTLSFQ